jgi:hypothetical protein
MPKHQHAPRLTPRLRPDLVYHVEVTYRPLDRVAPRRFSVGIPQPQAPEPRWLRHTDRRTPCQFEYRSVTVAAVLLRHALYVAKLGNRWTAPQLAKRLAPAFAVEVLDGLVTHSWQPRVYTLTHPEVLAWVALQQMAKA